MKARSTDRHQEIMFYHNIFLQSHHINIQIVNITNNNHKHMNQYESTLTMLEICNQVNELILNISDKEEILRYFDDIEDADYNSFMREIDAYVDNEFTKELQSGLYSEAMKKQLTEAKEALQFATA